MRLYAFIGDMEFIGLADISVSHVGAQLQVQNSVNKSWVELLKGNGSQLKVSGTMIYNNSDAVKTLRDNIELTSGFTSIRLKRSVHDNELYSITGFCKFSDSAQQQYYLQKMARLTIAYWAKWKLQTASTARL